MVGGNGKAGTLLNARKIALVALLGLLVLIFFGTDVRQYLTLESLKANRRLLAAFYDRHELLVVLGFMAVYIVQTALSLPGAAILSLAAGAIFGTLMGTVYAVAAATVGATLAFIVTRYLLRDMVVRRFAGRLAGLDRELEQGGLSYLLFLRLVPLFPFFLINLAAGITGMRLRTFVAGTFIGIIPGGMVYVNAGSSLASVTSPADVISPRVLGGFVLLGVVALVPAIVKRRRTRP